jgi:Bacterial conjugation TrbI-like protein
MATQKKFQMPDKIWGMKPEFAFLGIFIVVVVILSQIFKERPGTQAAQSGAATGNAIANAAPSAQFNQIFAERLRAEMDQRTKEAQVKTKEEIEQLQRANAADIAQKLEQQKNELLEQIKAIQPPPPAVQATPPVQQEPKRVIPPTVIPAPTASPASLPNSDGASRPNVLKAVIPAQGFMKARLLNGIIVRSDQPRVFLARVNGVYQAPNGYRMDLNGCHISIEASADLSAGRVDGKPVRLTCTLRNGQAENWDLSGYIVDQDGLRGLSGKVNNQNTDKIATSALAGAITGAGNVLSQRNTTVTSNGSSTTTSVVGDVGRAVVGGALGGAGSAIQQNLQDYYQTFRTTIEVSNTSEFSIVLLNQLELSSSSAHLSRVQARSDGGPVFAPAPTEAAQLSQPQQQ